ncbi:hypothetical protein T05_8317 [Trichinella murrelli]|uniref:Uncharacterized protein n=1 Tax=Trichinella murrelli TaxID=144512 RepID=A0A0V0TIV7_9BILA|nr:hypothetical protein T05_8317 [Trichinella murrelli]
MPRRVAWAGSWMIQTLEPSVMVISPDCQSKVGTQDPWYDQAFHNDNVKASPPASHLQRQRPLAAKAHSSPVAEGSLRWLLEVLSRWTCTRSRVALQKQPPRCPEGGKSPARLAYL